MPQQWNDLLEGISRTFSRYVNYLGIETKRYWSWSQCTIPVFEGLLPSPHNEFVLDLLFDLVTWHSFAKLQMHMDDTISFFDTAITRLGYSVWKFQKTTCTSYQTTELPQESAARMRHHAALIAKGPRSARQPSSMPTIMKLNLSTYKYHALGDYPNTIRQFGTTNSYSTQMVWFPSL